MHLHWRVLTVPGFTLKQLKSSCEKFQGIANYPSSTLWAKQMISTIVATYLSQHVLRKLSTCWFIFSHRIKSGLASSFSCVSMMSCSNITVVRVISSCCNGYPFFIRNVVDRFLFSFMLYFRLKLKIIINLI